MGRWLGLCSGSLVLLVAACSAGGSGGPDTVLANGGTPNSSGGGSSGNNTGGSSAGEGVLPPPPETDPTALCGESSAGLPGLRRLSRRELENTLRDVFPNLGATWASTLSADSISELGFDNDEGMLLVSKQTAREVAETAEGVAGILVGALPQVLPCAQTTPEASCAAQLLNAQGRRLFRRPLSQAERDTFLGFFNTAFSATADFNQSIGWLIRALIESPEFLYRREIGTAAGGVVQLNQYEIAAELAYTFSGSAPSEELLGRAEQNELTSKETLVGIARELLVTSGRAVVRNFFDSYVGHSRVTTIAKAEVAEFAALRPDMLEETRRFIDEVIFERNGGVRELFTANFTTPTGDLATFYGLTTPASDYAVTERPAGKGVGLLAQGAVLATLSQPNGSSPTKRGLWIHKHLLCNPVPMVPPNIPELDLAISDEQRTTRQRYSEVHAKGGCQLCHSRWDPIGFAFEHFDEAGRWRDAEGTDLQLPVDSASYVPEQGVPFDRPPNPDAKLFEFTGQEDMITQLVEYPVVHQCFSGYLSSYAFGGPLTCAAETRRAEFIAGTIGFIDYLASHAGEPHFTERRVEAAP